MRLHWLLCLLALTVVVGGCISLPGKDEHSEYVVSGRVVDPKGAGVHGVTLLAGTSVDTTATDGSWVLTGLKGAVVIMPSLEGYEFSPAHVSVSGPRDGILFTMHPAQNGSEPNPYNACEDPALLSALAASTYALLGGPGYLAGRLEQNDGGDVIMQADTPIMGAAVATRDQARRWLSAELSKRGGEAEWMDMADLYYDIAPLYGIRPDVALAQAAHETAYFGFGNLVQPWQNNFAGIGATGAASDGNTPLNGADPTRVCFRKGIHGAIFADRATGVEAQVQHLFAYATTAPLPPGRVLLSPRFTLVSRGIAPTVEALSGRWATDQQYHTKILALLQAMINA